MEHTFKARLACFGLLVLVLFPMAAHAGPLTTSDSAAKIVNLMQADSYNFQTTKSPTVWMIRFNGDHLKDIKVVLTVKDFHRDCFRHAGSESAHACYH